MTTRVIETDDPAIEEAERILREGFGRGLDAFGGAAVEVVGGFEGGALVALGLFRDYRDPALHVGNELDLERLRDIVEMPEVGLYQVALLHAKEDRIALKDAAKDLVTGFEALLERRFERYCLFITLMREANRPALPLYRELGFKASGRPSHLMRFDLEALEGRLRRIPPLPEGMQLRFFDEAGEQERTGFVGCYRRVFLKGVAPGAAALDRDLSRVTSGPDFFAPLSVLLKDGRTGEVLGFLLAERPAPDRMHITAAGLLPQIRGLRLPSRCMPAIARRALDLGVKEARFVTTRGRVVRLALRAFGAREVDRLDTYFKVG